MPGRIVLPRIFHLPVADRAKMATMVQFEAKRHVPTRLDQLVWDFQVMPGGQGNGFAGTKTRRKRALPRCSSPPPAASCCNGGSTFCSGRASPSTRQCECIADCTIFFMFQRAAVPAKATPENGKPAADPLQNGWPVMLVNVGGDGSNLLIGSPSGLWVRHLGFGGYSVTRLVRQFHLTAAQAEELKRNPASAPNLTEFYAR